MKQVRNETGIFCGFSHLFIGQRLKINKSNILLWQTDTARDIDYIHNIYVFPVMPTSCIQDLIASTCDFGLFHILTC